MALALHDASVKHLDTLSEVGLSWACRNSEVSLSVSVLRRRNMGRRCTLEVLRLLLSILQGPLRHVRMVIVQHCSNVKHSLE